MKIKAVISFAMAFAACFILSLSAFAFTAGDVDNDGKISATDARTVLRASVGLDTLTGEKLKAGDIDGDGKPSASDARMILRASVGLEDLHKHDYKKTVTSAPTCLKGGEQKLTCSCGDVKTEKLPAAGHKSEVIKAVPATCTKDGRSEGAKCSVCGEILTAQKAVPATGHKSVTDKAVEATCTKDGKTQGAHCSVCKAVLTPQLRIPAGHKRVSDNNGVAATCTKAGKSPSYHCSVCKKTVTPQLTIPAGHKFSTTDPTKSTVCTVKGCNATMPSFNSIVNTLKTTDDGVHYFTGIFKDETHYGTTEIGGLMGSMMEGSSVAGSDVVYGPVSKYRFITPANFPVNYETAVSALTASDVRSISAQTVSGIEFLDEIDTVFTDGTRTYDASSIKKNVFEPVYKITLVLPTQKNDISKKVSGSSVFDRIYTSDYNSMLEKVRAQMVAEFSGLERELAEFGDLVSVKSAGNIVSSVAVDYYVKASDFSPVAAKYRLGFDVLLDIKVTDITGITKLVTMKQEMDMVSNSYYFFDKDFGL